MQPAMIADPSSFAVVKAIKSRTSIRSSKSPGSIILSRFFSFSLCFILLLSSDFPMDFLDCLSGNSIGLILTGRGDSKMIVAILAQNVIFILNMGIFTHTVDKSDATSHH